MTDARFPERWLNDRRVMRLSPEAFRAFVVALTWSVANRTDGLVSADDLDLIPHTTVPLMGDLADAELVDCAEAGWTFRDFETTQRTAAQLEADEAHRLHERDKKRRQRAHRAGDHRLCTDGTCAVPGDVPGDDTGQGRTGQGRASKASTYEQEDSTQTAGWPEVMS